MASVIGKNNIGNDLKNMTADLLSNSDFISRTIGMNGSYSEIMFLVRLLGREPISLLGKDYPYIYDHVRRNYLQGTEIMNGYQCPKFTFYKEKPIIRFANPYDDPKNLSNDKWTPSVTFTSTLNGVKEYFYAEAEGNLQGNIDINEVSANTGTYHGQVESFKDFDTCDIIKKTNDNFKKGLYKTLIARFHTSEDEGDLTNPIQTAVSKKYGMSHGRNLQKGSNSKKDSEDKPSYDNPYCRVWTYHHQYHTAQDMIRPFGGVNSAEELIEEMGNGNSKNVSFRISGDTDTEKGFGSSSSRLDKYGVLNYSNNMVTIAPNAKLKDYFEHTSNDKDKFSPKRCMFSIENLAWKDIKSRNDEYYQYGLSPEQRGPFGGRIMWFPPYGLEFNESVTVNWNSNKFIGRGEDVYTYTNTERYGNLSFMMIIDHPSIIDYWESRNGTDNQSNQSVDDIDSPEQKLLRFFAGCDILKAQPQKYAKRIWKAKEVEKEKTDDIDKNDGGKPKKIVSVLYFPNNYSGVNDRNNIGMVQPIPYLMNGVGTQKCINPTTLDADDMECPIDIKPSGVDFSGYEINDDPLKLGGISHVLAELEPNYDIIETTYADLETTERKGQYLTHANGDRISVSYDGSRFYTLAKMVSKKSMSLGDANDKANLTGNTHMWYRRRYYYRVDEAYINDDFDNPMSYIDAKSFGLNSKGFDKIKTYDKIKTDFSLNDAELVSFSDLFVALQGDNTVISPVNENNVKLIRQILTNKNYEIKVSFIGHASYQGRVNSNNKLALERGETLKHWMKQSNLMQGVNVDEKVSIVNQQDNPQINIGNVDEELVKIWRSASVVIEYKERSISNAATAEASRVDKDSASIPNKNTSQTVSQKDLDSPNPYLGEFDGTSNNEENYTVTNNLSVNRYDNEGEFFKVLTKEDPFLHHLITDKIKYFDPAFHSVSPEGFNARLTFLHQCTRQGSTVEHSSADASTAYNLAFGRPPVCVLRIGDFYYTKIIIDSLDIQYETPQWDLNPEGIGVMPMFAKISIRFKFLGGSDLGGPIARLQNAVSFNYYANTSVYDNRAEMVEYDENGSGDEVKFKGFHYPNDLDNKNN